MLEFSASAYMTDTQLSRLKRIPAVSPKNMRMPLQSKVKDIVYKLKAFESIAALSNLRRKIRMFI